MISNNTAPLKNVSLIMEVLERAISTPSHLPRMATFHGHSGYGKTISAIYAANAHNAIYVEVGDSWSKSSLCDALLAELGTKVSGTIAKKVEKIIELVIMQNRPIIIDEFDVLIRKNLIDTVREIYDKTRIPMLLIGEELLIQKLEQNERFHNRILEPFVAAEPADREDMKNLCRMYCPGIEITDDLVSRLHKVSQGRVRRICSNLNHIREFAEVRGLKNIGLTEFGEDQLATGMSPMRRAV